MVQIIQEQINYSSLGLKCGLELHQQLETGRKLFCNCKSELQINEPKVRIVRHMRPTLSELGEYDAAALMEFKKKKTIVYEVHDSVCTYEIDETPPFEADPNAIDLAITISRMLQMEILNELHVNRKQYLDGSIPSGFQRTMIVGIGGKVKVSGKIINLEMLALEEDSCREISSSGRNIVWRVDRLGIPLVEIATKTFVVNDPNEVRDIAEGIGRILRSTGKVKRGLGTIRQDLNISIEKGSRVEVKGVQKLDLLPEYLRLEVSRQMALIEIIEELKKRGLTEDELSTDYKNCSQLFKNSKSTIFIHAKKNKDQILGIKLKKMNGLLRKKIQSNRTFGKEIADRVSIITGLGGILHTDEELLNYGITKEEAKSLKDLFDCASEDVVVLVIGKQDDGLQAINEIIIRIKEALKGIPEETRHANDDGTTSFRRYLGGAGRMYPDTDLAPIDIPVTRIKRIEESLPELPDVKEQKYKQDYKIPDEITKELVISPYNTLFEKLIKLEIDPILVAVTLVQTLKAFARDALPIDNLTESKIYDIFNLLKNKKITKEAIEPLLRYSIENPKDKIEDVIKKLGLETLTPHQLGLIIDKILEENIIEIKENEHKAMSKIMGFVMKEVRGKIEGKIVNEILNEKLTHRIQEIKNSLK